MRILLCLFIFQASLPSIFSQENINVETLIRYELDSIDGVYIPKDINDAIKQISSFWDDSTQQDIKKMTEDKFLADAHFGIGMWIRNNWGLWGGSKISNYFNKLAVFHPDDMSSIILTSYYRYLCERDVELEEQVSSYKKYWEQIKSESISGIQQPNKNTENDMSQLRSRQIVYYDYPYGFSSSEEENYSTVNDFLATGEIVDIDLDKGLLKIKLLKCYAPYGIIIYDTSGGGIRYKDEEYDYKGKIIEKNGRQIFYMREGDEFWFSTQNDYWISDDEI